MRSRIDQRTWDRLEAIFHEAVAIAPADRRDFLDRRCGGDPLLRERIERMLAFDREVAFFDTPALAEFDEQREESDVRFDPLLNRKVGPYRLIERLAEGGMGVIYRAVRDDDLFTQEVAIKIVRHGASAPELLERFRDERKALAQLNHPNIARLLDGGATEEGTPYLVMEFIHGDPIDRYCDEQRLTIDERLGLFETVCHAVHFAHQNLIIHRDLKPGNILVTPDGQPKLLDFGIAKILKEGQPPHALARTVTAARALTPDYASPEQITGDAISTATDIYSLGVLLYELLTDRLPYRIEGVRIDQLERAIIEQPARRPSVAVHTMEPVNTSNQPTATLNEIARLRRTTPTRLERALRGDLENILLMALRKEPERRYASAEQFAEDLARYRTEQPVIARPDTLWYRARMFVQRNRIAVSAAAIIFLSLLLGVIGTSWMAHIASDQRDAAQRAEQQAQADAEHARIEADSMYDVTQFLFESIEAANLMAGPEERAALTTQLQQNASRVRSAYRDQPHLQANLLDAIGRVGTQTDLHELAESLLIEAARLREAEFGPRSLEAALSLRSHGQLELSRGRPDQAVQHFREALEIHRTAPSGVHTDVASAAFELAEASVQAGDVSAAESLHREALELRRAELDEQNLLVAESHAALGRLLAAQNRNSEAAEHLQTAVEIRRALLDETDPLIAELEQQLDTLRPDG